MTGRREALLRREADEWSRLIASLEGLDDADLERPGCTPEGWSIKDLLWHVAAWSDDAARVLDKMREGTWNGEDPSREPGWIDRVNREWFERSRTMPLAEVRSASLEARARLLAAFGALEDVTPDAVEWFEESGPTHYAEHLPGMQAWIAAQRPGP